MALRGDGTVWAWGRNDYGQLGIGTLYRSPTPAQVSGLTGVTAIAVGGYHCLALKDDGSVWAWGYNNHGQLGDGTTANRSTPVQIPGLTGVIAISAGGFHGAALRSDGHSDRELLPKPVVWGAAAPIGSVSINGGALYTNSGSVTLDLPATDDSGAVAQMCITSDGAFDTEPWQDYEPRVSWELAPGDGSRGVIVLFRDSSGSTSDRAIDSIIVDSTPPTIASAIASPEMVAQGDSVALAVSVTDSRGVKSVTAGGIGLNRGTSIWSGQIEAGAPNGVKTVVVAATDNAGNTASAEATYSVVPVVGASCRSITDGAMTGACGNYIFRFWGKVIIIDSGSFWLDDGSGPRLKVIAPGYAGLTNGSYASARGILDPTATPPTLTCPATKIRKLN